MVSHGHIVVDGKRVTIPSFSVRSGNSIGIRKGSKDAALFGDLALRLKDYSPPRWLIFDEKNLEGKMKNAPTVDMKTGEPINLASVLDFYGR